MRERVVSTCNCVCVCACVRACVRVCVCYMYTAMTESRLWVLDRQVFQAIMMTTGIRRQEETMKFLRRWQSVSQWPSYVLNITGCSLAHRVSIIIVCCNIPLLLLLLLLLLQPFNGLFSTTTCTSRYRKGKTSLDLNEAGDDGVLGWQWRHPDHMQTICTSLQTDNHINTSSLNFYRPDALRDAHPPVPKHWRQKAVVCCNMLVDIDPARASGRCRW